VVLYFYPKDFTSGCTLEAHNFQRDIAKYGDAGAVILGVSVDTAQSHKDFCAKEGSISNCSLTPTRKSLPSTVQYGLQRPKGRRA
jgi:Peroxiredoxin